MSDRLLVYIAFIFILRHVQGMVNFALNKSAKQSTTLTWNSFNWTADKAVDGNSDGSFPDTSGTCSATNFFESIVIHTWEVDIGVQITVKNITVYGRTDKHSDQLDNFTVYLGNTSEPWKYSTGRRSGPATVIPNSKYVFNINNTNARYIALVRYNTIMTICEVNVEGDCTPGTYGSGCTEICGHCNNGNTRCSPTDGMCMDGCEAGWRGGTCKLNCTAGTYGSGCSEICGHCYHGNTRCSTIDGMCMDGCEVGWRGGTCILKCDRGTYGYNCNETCGMCLYGNISCSTSNGSCSSGCNAGWQGDNCKKECYRGTYGYNCSKSCGNCLHGNISCSTSNGTCSNGCDAGWQGNDCKTGCDMGKFGYNCNETCGNCLNGTISCSTLHGTCSSGCDYGWYGNDCKTSTLEKVTSSDVGPDVGVIVGSSLAAVGVFAIVIVIIIVILKKRKKNTKETSALQLTTSSHYANLPIDIAGSEINVRSIEEKKTTILDKEDSRLQRRNSTGVSNSPVRLIEPDVHANKEYEKLRVGSKSDESAYSTIDHALMSDREIESMEKYNNFSENIQLLESALKTIEEEISSLLIRKENLLSNELEKARANKLREKRKEKDCTMIDNDTDFTNDNFAETFQSLEVELKMLVKKKQYLLQRKEILLRNELSKIVEN